MLSKEKVLIKHKIARTGVAAYDVRQTSHYPKKLQVIRSETHMLLCTGYYTKNTMFVALFHCYFH